MQNDLFNQKLGLTYQSRMTDFQNALSHQGALENILTKGTAMMGRSGIFGQGNPVSQQANRSVYGSSNLFNSGGNLDIGTFRNNGGYSTYNDFLQNLR